MIVGWPDSSSMWVEFCAPAGDVGGFEIVGAERCTADEDGGWGYVLFRRDGDLYLATFADNAGFQPERQWNPRPISVTEAEAFANLKTADGPLLKHLSAALQMTSLLTFDL